ncbi:hypothetical protein HKK80_13730 [Halonotius sp. F2-221B]|uniref:hypothetical protein n=1 Tax=Halonotius sp. F2-221B TaxID=2731620 RepID=UPI00398B4581
MASNASLDVPDDQPQSEQTEIILLDEDTEQEIGAVSGCSPPIPAVGDLVSLHNFQFTDDANTTRPRGEQDMSFRVVDRAVHYSIVDADAQGLTTEVRLYVVSKEEWAVRRQRGN